MNARARSYKATAECRNRTLGSVTRRWLAGLGLSAGVALMPAAAHASPEGGETVVGTPASIETHHDYHPEAGQPGSQYTDSFTSFTEVTTYSQQTGIQWKSLGIAESEGLYFDQPSAQSSVWNFVPDSTQTVIEGYLGSNGTVGVSNPAGIYIDGRAVVDVGELIAAAGSLAPEAFEAGELHFTNVQGDVRVGPEAEIRADAVALIGRHVANHGSIVAREASIALVAGDEVWLGEHGSPIRIHMTGLGASGGDDAPYAVENTGALTAAHGRVRLAAGDFLAMAVRNTGDILAREIAVAGGRDGRVELSGTLTARDESSERGGTIEVTGDWIALRGATLDASGAAGGGSIHVGGEVGGQGDTPTARGVYVSRDTALRADALEEGDGGEIVVWGDEIARVYGELSAQGGARGGDGGFIETSSRGTLEVAAHINAGASHGAPGQWLLDPANVTIDDFEDGGGIDGAVDDDTGFKEFQPYTPDSRVDVTAIVEALEAGSNVKVTTETWYPEQVDQDGDIKVKADIVVSKIRGGFVTLWLAAANHIIVGDETEGGDIVGNITNTFEEGRLNIQLNANDPTQPENASQFGVGDVTIIGDIETGGGALNASGENISVKGRIDTRLLDPPDESFGGNVDLRSTKAISVENQIITQGGLVTASGETFTTTSEGQIDTTGSSATVLPDGRIEIALSGQGTIGADLHSGEIRIGAGGGGSGDLDIRDQTLTADSISLHAGSTQGSESKILTSEQTRFQSLDGGAPKSLDFVQDAALVDDDIPELNEFGDGNLDHLGGMDYLLGSNTRPVTLSTANKVVGGDLTLVGESFTEGDETIPAVNVENEIQPRSVTIKTTGAFEVSTDLASNLRPQGGNYDDDDPTTSGIRFDVGLGGSGDLTFEPGATLKSDRIYLRAGSGIGGHDTAIVDTITGTPMFQGQLDGQNPVEFTVRQDADIFDSRQNEDNETETGTTIPDALQFPTGDVDGIAYTLRSDAGEIRIEDAATVDKLEYTRLTLLARRGIHLFEPPAEPPVEPPAADPVLTVMSAEVGGLESFEVTGQLISKLNITGDPDPSGDKVLKLRAGVASEEYDDEGYFIDYAKLTFESDLQLRADEIRLIAGSEDASRPVLGEIVLDDPEDENYVKPRFLSPDGLTAPKRFVFQQTNAIAQSLDVLPTADQFGPEGPPGENTKVEIYGIRSRTSIALNELHLIDDSVKFSNGKLILSSPVINVQRTADDYVGTLKLDQRHQLRGNEIILRTAESSLPVSQRPKVDAVDMRDDSIRAFDDEQEFDLLAEPTPSEPGASPYSFTIDQLGGFGSSQSDDPHKDLLPNASAFAGGFATASDGVMRYTLISREGTLYYDEGTDPNENEYGIEVVPEKVNGTALTLLLGGRATGEPGDEGEEGADFENIGTIDFGTTLLDVESLDARTARDFKVNDGARIRAEKSLQLYAGGSSELITLGTDLGTGDLSFGWYVELRAEGIKLVAGYNDNTSVVDAKGTTKFRLTPAQQRDDTSFLVRQTDTIRNITHTGLEDLGNGSLPDPSQFVGSLPSVDRYNLKSVAGDIEINNPSEIGIGEGVPTPGLVTLVGASVIIEQNTIGGEDLVIANDLIAASDSITLSAPNGDVKVDEELDETSFGAPSFFTVSEGTAIDSSTDLPDPSQFTVGLENVAYTVESTGGGITVDADFAENVARSQLVLQASDGYDVEIENADLDLTSLSLYPAVGMRLLVGNDASIQTDADQEYRNPVILTRDTARFEAPNVTFHERVDGQSDTATGSLLVEASDGVSFHANVGAEVPLDSFQINLERREPDFVDGDIETPPVPTVEFGPSEDADPAPFEVYAQRIFLNPDPDSPYADRAHPGHDRSVIPPTATFFRRQGDLTFQTGDGGIFEMGQHEKLSVADGNLTINTNDGQAIPDSLPPGDSADIYGRALIGDLSAAGKLGAAGNIRVESGVIQMLLREGGKVLRNNGRLENDAGVDYVANQIDFDFVVENDDPGETLRRSQIGHDAIARFGIADANSAPVWMNGFPVASIRNNLLENPYGGAVLDGIPDGTARAEASAVLSAPVPGPGFDLPPRPLPVDPAPLADVGIRIRPVANAEYRSQLSGAAIYDDLTSDPLPGGPQVSVVEARLVGDEAARAAALFKRVFGADGSRATEIRAVLQKALDDYRRSTGAQRVVGFEFRRYVNNRPSTQFEAYRTLQSLDALLRHHRRSGLAPAEYRGIQRSWLEDIKPEGISLGELAEALHPSRYVRGSDVLDVFGD